MMDEIKCLAQGLDFRKGKIKKYLLEIFKDAEKPEYDAKKKSFQLTKELSEGKLILKLWGGEVFDDRHRLWLENAYILCAILNGEVVFEKVEYVPAEIYETYNFLLNKRKDLSDTEKLSRLEKALKE